MAKVELEKYQENQVYLLVDGRFALITDVSPLTKMRPTEKERMVSFNVGHTRCKGDEFKDTTLTTIDETPLNGSITIMQNSESMNIELFRRHEAAYIGTLTEDKAKQFHKIKADYINRL